MFINFNIFRTMPVSFYSNRVKGHKLNLEIRGKLEDFKKNKLKSIEE